MPHDVIHRPSVPLALLPGSRPYLRPPACNRSWSRVSAQACGVFLCVGGCTSACVATYILAYIGHCCWSAALHAPMAESRDPIGQPPWSVGRPETWSPSSCPGKSKAERLEPSHSIMARLSIRPAGQGSRAAGLPPAGVACIAHGPLSRGLRSNATT